MQRKPPQATDTAAIMAAIERKHNGGEVVRGCYCPKCAKVHGGSEADRVIERLLATTHQAAYGCECLAIHG